jgi:hypothetical protein
MQLGHSLRPHHTRPGDPSRPTACHALVRATPAGWVRRAQDSFSGYFHLQRSATVAGGDHRLLKEPAVAAEQVLVR